MERLATTAPILMLDGTMETSFWLAPAAAPTTTPSGSWLTNLFSRSSPAQVAVVLSLVAVLGIALGSIRIRRVGLGIAGVLFAGLFGGHLLHQNGIELDHPTLDFAKEFGLILFVYTIGMQVGPGFLDSLRRNGLPLNLLAAGVVISGAVIALGIHKLLGVDLPIAAGLFSGATTNTPSLAAAQEAIKQVMAQSPGRLPDNATVQPALGYAVAYPFGIVGIILTMLLTRWFFRVDVKRENDEFMSALGSERPRLDSMSIEVTNANLVGLTLDQVPLVRSGEVVVSRIVRGGQAQPATVDVKLQLGDVLLAVGREADLRDVRLVVGKESGMDVRAVPGPVVNRWLIVTRREVLGKTLEQLDLRQRYGVNVTRINRAEIELPPADVRLQFGDRVMLVGNADAIRSVEELIGNSVKRLNHPQVVPVFVGIALGVLVGSIPLAIPGLPAPVKLGLAGGPLLMAIILSRMGHFGPVVWHMPLSANLITRELGIVLFLACVGLAAGPNFVSSIASGDGLYWMGLGALITAGPMLLAALVGRALMKLNFLSLCGLLAGSMTDPPALQFAGQMTGSDAPSVSYATVYPLVMLLRIISAQVLILVFA
jgi:putative transport protein